MCFISELASFLDGKRFKQAEDILPQFHQISITHMAPITTIKNQRLHYNSCKENL